MAPGDWWDDKAEVDNGINPTTDLPWGVYPDKGSPTGYTHTASGTPVYKDGSGWSGGTTDRAISINVAAPVTWGPSQTDDGTVTGVPGAVYQTNSRGDISIISKPTTTKPAASLWNDENGDGYDDQSGLPNGVTSVGGKLYFQGKRVNPDGSLYTGTEEAKDAPTWTGYGPKGQGTYRLDGPGGTPGTFIGPTTAAGAGISSSSGGGGSSSSGGGSSGGGGSASSRSGGYNNTDTKYNYSTSSSSSTSDIGPNSMANSAMDRAQQASQFAATMGLNQSKEARDKAALYAQLLSTVDPNAYQAFLEKSGGGRLDNALLSGGNALSDNALRPAAELYGGSAGGGLQMTTGGGGLQMEGGGPVSPGAGGGLPSAPATAPAPVDPYAQYGAVPEGWASWQEWAQNNIDRRNIARNGGRPIDKGQGGASEAELMQEANFYNQVRLAGPNAGGSGMDFDPTGGGEGGMRGSLEFVRGVDRNTGTVTGRGRDTSGMSFEDIQNSRLGGYDQFGKLIVSPYAGYQPARGGIRGYAYTIDPKTGQQVHAPYTPGQYIGGGQYAPDPAAQARDDRQRELPPAIPYGNDDIQREIPQKTVIPMLAGGGLTRDQQMIVGDPQRDGRPNPEMIMNPTGAPISVVPMRNMMAVGGLPHYAYGSEFDNDIDPAAATYQRPVYQQAVAPVYQGKAPAPVYQQPAPVAQPVATAPAQPAAAPVNNPAQIGGYSTAPGSAGTPNNTYTPPPVYLNTPSPAPAAPPSMTSSGPVTGLYIPPTKPPPWAAPGYTQPNGGQVPLAPYTKPTPPATAPVSPASVGPQPMNASASVVSGASGGSAQPSQAAFDEVLFTRLAAVHPWMQNPTEYMNTDYETRDPVARRSYEQYLTMRFGVPQESIDFARARTRLGGASMASMSQGR